MLKRLLDLGGFAVTPFASPAVRRDSTPREIEPAQHGQPGCESNASATDVPGRVWALSATCGAFDIACFDPDRDRIHLRIENPEVTIETICLEDADPKLQLRLPDGASMTICFTGLQVVPAEAVRFMVPDVFDGETLCLTLNEVMKLSSRSKTNVGAPASIRDEFQSLEGTIFDAPFDDGTVPLVALSLFGTAMDPAPTTLDAVLPDAQGKSPHIQMPCARASWI